VKRALDVVAAATLLVVLAPVELLAIVAVALDGLSVRRDRGPLFYRERRISRGRPFDLLKLRTLRCDVLAGAAGHARLLEGEPANLTWAGRHVLKPWYLDELPQLINVLRGEISLVGPRPWPPELVARQVASGHDYRLHVAAGLTGPAQVSKGTGKAFLDLDLEYVHALRTLGPLRVVRLDLAILRRTLSVLARGEGLRF
jgi:lipopolysaccharide/colanic/teichoic acid biosynthesis glycosyltransferase